jgi:hypothetical protein
MGAAKYIGRTGGLAIALGIGAAVFSGPGIASATPASSGSSTNPSSPSLSNSGSAAGSSVGMSTSTATGEISEVHGPLPSRSGETEVLKPERWPHRPRGADADSGMNAKSTDTPNTGGAHHQHKKAAQNPQ